MRWYRLLGIVVFLDLFLVVLGGAYAQKVTVTIQDYFDPAGGMAKFVDRWAEEYMKKTPS